MRYRVKQTRYINTEQRSNLVVSLALDRKLFIVLDSLNERLQYGNEAKTMMSWAIQCSHSFIRHVCQYMRKTTNQ